MVQIMQYAKIAPRNKKNNRQEFNLPVESLMASNVTSNPVFGGFDGMPFPRLGILGRHFCKASKNFRLGHNNGNFVIVGMILDFQDHCIIDLDWNDRRRWRCKTKRQSAHSFPLTKWQHFYFLNWIQRRLPFLPGAQRTRTISQKNVAGRK